ncbi:hypothetical protein LRP52_35940 [Photobacterium sp. ZSDE20]|uniref:Uncharacterized protein n=1 Tax=Photobacterium pectinilyticum TaxID=2906793 RepID=A0ABT1N5X2_9GAMM|nr:hypothetical protein [Photobacterium sp. ZSDE20]MCQ1060121.1 hypothetical protein [Photobacterium sp. ZSDE20]MDD1827577.1 hypothetical protein [Photobacterium sp. ZSDE20]
MQNNPIVKLIKQEKYQAAAKMLNSKELGRLEAWSYMRVIVGMQTVQYDSALVQVLLPACGYGSSEAIELFETQRVRQVKCPNLKSWLVWQYKQAEHLMTKSLIGSLLHNGTPRIRRSA